MRSRTITGQFFLQCTGNSLLRKEKNKKKIFYDLVRSILCIRVENSQGDQAGRRKSPRRLNYTL